MHPCNHPAASLTRRLPGLRLLLPPPLRPSSSLAFPPSGPLLTAARPLQLCPASAGARLCVPAPPFMSGGELPSSAASMSDLVLRAKNALADTWLAAIRALGKPPFCIRKQWPRLVHIHTCNTPCCALHPPPCNGTCPTGTPGLLFAWHCPRSRMIRLRVLYQTGWPLA